MTDEQKSLEIELKYRVVISLSLALEGAYQMLNSDFVITNQVVTSGGYHRLRYWDGRGSFQDAERYVHIYATREKAEAAVARIKDKDSFKDFINVGYMTSSDLAEKLKELQALNEVVEAKNAEKIAQAKAERANGPKPDIILRWLTGYRDQAQEALDTFAETFKKNPLYALEWVDAQFTHAATLELTSKYINVLAYHAGEGTPELEVTKDIKESVERDFIFRASLNTNFSTGQGTNLLEGARVVVLGNFYRWLKGL